MILALLGNIGVVIYQAGRIVSRFEAVTNRLGSLEQAVDSKHEDFDVRLRNVENRLTGIEAVMEDHNNAR